VDRSAEQVAEVHLQATEREPAGWVQGVGLDNEIDVAVGAKTVGEK
jgi:hypothetical protein